MEIIKLELTGREYRVILGALAEVVGSIHADELPLLVGASIVEIGFVSDKVRAQGDRQGATW